jgi:cleavage stimulation factor subunit 3
MAYSWANTVGKHDEALAFLKAGLEANPARLTFLSHFLYSRA